jgi:FkbH-like protein
MALVHDTPAPSGGRRLRRPKTPTSGCDQDKGPSHAVTQLHWLPLDPARRDRLRALRALTEPSECAWDEAVALANTQLDFTATNALDAAVRTLFKSTVPPGLATKPVRLAVLGSSTLAHLLPAIRVAGLRRGIWIDTYENDYGQYRQELADPASPLHEFRPNMVLLALDAAHLAAATHAGLSAQDAEAALRQTTANLAHCWKLARDAFKCPVIQQTALPVHPPLLGSNEHRLPGSRATFIARLNEALRPLADTEGVELLALDERAARDGLRAWHDAGLWHRSKQEVTLPAAPMYGELVARIVAARQGRSFKCLVLDLDNTLWGGVIGDDGMDGIVLGQGSPLGEAFSALQDYAREQARRGVILAVCSKNDEANAVEPFNDHPDMLLKRMDIASFMANWQDKASNLRAIAHSLSIGLDAMVFVDDNPAERALIRRELPMVAVPEIPDDPAWVVPCLADAGYFEGLAVTKEDRERSVQYQGNIHREVLRAASTDMDSYLAGLRMELLYRPFERTGLSRIVQLINKTNQFNLTTRRYTEDDVLAVMQDKNAFGLQLRLLDAFGDNGIIAIVIGRPAPQKGNPTGSHNRMDDRGDIVIDTWLMSCRVLGRQVEQATMNQVAAQSLALGASRIIGEFRPTKKNAMVRDHYTKLGFRPLPQQTDGTILSALDLAGFTPAETFITIREG